MKKLFENTTALLALAFIIAGSLNNWDFFKTSDFKPDLDGIGKELEEELRKMI